MAETFQEKIDRVHAMRDDVLGRKWDLSDNDRAALAAILAERTALRRFESAARNAAACTCDSSACEALADFWNAREALDALRASGATSADALGT